MPLPNNDNTGNIQFPVHMLGQVDPQQELINQQIRMACLSQAIQGNYDSHPREIINAARHYFNYIKDG